MPAAPLPPRFEDWPRRLAELIAERRDVPFAYGVNDCATFAAEWVRRATGLELDVPHVEDVPAAQLALEALDGIEAATTALLGEPLADVRLATRGDVGITDAPGQGPALCVVEGVHVVAPGTRGLVFLRRDRLVRAWRI